MGNATKGLYSKEEHLYYYINRRDFQHIQQILDKHPDIINKPITKDTKQTPLMRAAFNCHLETVEFLIREGANVNEISSKGQTALSIAVKKNKLNIAKKLIQCGADPTFVNKNGLSIIDFAILPGYYDIATLIYSRLKQKNLKESFEYEDFAKKYSYRYVNYKMFIQGLKNQSDSYDLGNFLVKPKIEFHDPVPDPRQSWKDWAKRNLEFKDAPLVQRSSLPEELQPQNRKLGKVDIFIHNWTRTKGKERVKYNPKEGHKEVMSQMGGLAHEKDYSEKPEIKSEI